ncbi:selenium-binding protein SBP56-related protein [Methylocapsa acidiphila]|uniref:selenium-binding protein SBP56-related protein n=1 Tax=Methylocapsa acidiphila TaxID=133552 RepID=UPI000410F070|nr:selenium-binding protein SBP56-related protein [Methylocapsa acidiphila]
MQTNVAGRLAAAIVAACLGAVAPLARADETCLSPYMAALIKGQEAYLHVWALGEKGIGDESDKLVTIDVDPKSKTYGKPIDKISVGGQGEAHHMGFTDDRKYLWAGRLDDSKIFIFDVGTDPAHPKLVRTIDDLPEKTGYVGPHTFYAIPGRMVIGALSNTTHDGVTGLAVYNNQGEFLSAHPIPAENGGDGYGYDIAINPKKNVMLTSSFTGWDNYMRDLGGLVQDAEAMQNFGNTMVLWNLKSMEPEKVLAVPGAPLEIRWSLKDGDDWAITATALTSKLWLVRRDAKGDWGAKEVGTIGDPAKIPLPVDISISADAKTLWVNTFMDGKTHLFDISDPEHPTQIYEKTTGKQVNMISQSWDGKRVYITSSLLANWDKKGADNEQVLRAYDWDGKDLNLKFEIDFFKEQLGRPHHMKFSAAADKASP